MKNALFLICMTLAACSSKHKDPGFTSAAGTWTYTTPDKVIGVTFELAKNSSGGLTIQNQTFVLNEVTYQSAAAITGVTLPGIQKITVNANDIKITYPYDIEFNNCTVSTDFTVINVPNATYTWPWGTTKTLTTIKISRK